MIMNQILGKTYKTNQEKGQYREFLNSKYARKSKNFIDIVVFLFGLFMLQYAMDVKWKMIGNE